MAEDPVRLTDVRTALPQTPGAFRSLQVYRCDVCGAHTNKAYSVDLMTGRGVRTLCAYSGESWHFLVWEKRRMLSRPHPKSYREEMEQEIQGILTKHHVNDDVVGDADWSTIY